jgi:hypothetical protein
MTVVSAGRPASAKNEKTTESIDRRTVAAALREQLFAIKSTDLKTVVASEDTQQRLYGVVIETAFPDVVASLVALLDGSVSLYVSDGSGCIGCGAHRDVQRVAADLLQVAERVLPETIAATEHALPTTNHVRLFLLTDAGWRMTQTTLDLAQRSDTPVGLIYFAGQRLVQTVERVGSGHSLQTEIESALGNSKALRAITTGNEPCLSVGNAVRRLRT